MASWTKPRTEKQERLFQQWKLDVQNVLVASKTGIDTRRLEVDLEENVGKCPVEAMGFTRWGEFLYAIRDIFRVGHFPQDNPHNPRNRLFLFINENAFLRTANEDVAAIAKLVRGQAKGKPTKRSDGTTNAPTTRQVNFCDPACLLEKTASNITRNPPPGSSSRPKYPSRAPVKYNNNKNYSSYGAPSRTAPYQAPPPAPKTFWPSDPPNLMSLNPGPPNQVRRYCLPPPSSSSSSDDVYCAPLPKVKAPQPRQMNGVVSQVRATQPQANTVSQKPRMTFQPREPEPLPSIPTPMAKPVPSTEKFVKPLTGPPSPMKAYIQPLTSSNLNEDRVDSASAPIVEKFTTTKYVTGPPQPMKLFTQPSASSSSVIRNPAPITGKIPLLPTPNFAPIPKTNEPRPQEDRVVWNHVPTAEKIVTMKPVTGPPCPMKPFISPPGSSSASSVSLVNGITRKSRPTFDAPDPVKSSPLLPTPTSVPISKAIEDIMTMNMKPMTGPSQPSRQVSAFARPQEIRVLRDCVQNDEKIVTMKHLTGPPCPMKPFTSSVKSTPLLPTPTSADRVLRDPVPNADKIATMKHLTGPPSPMKPFTQPSAPSSTRPYEGQVRRVNIDDTADTRRSGSTDNRVARVKVEPNFVEPPVMLNRGPRGRGRPLCRNGIRPTPAYYEDEDCAEVDLTDKDYALFDRIVRMPRDPVEQVRRLQFAEL